ncbi:MAG: succinate dehydrogenase/fumarate reductase iron-sulfur subunit [Armatimonadota bacterium]|nr:succinate dehydrogenase/fumarate reductase iron-sulfur subunit [Armatimonadota bacterium]MDR7401841.1 succinate dehydrogenase/fumarate reductase iron-sulfur subunit [Armatimonadota bacterium]MDR7437443.1 succinate dehydrogenase/fumarate reductase iron-sulfur subunit [Armatimonadota bacterium]MDR7473194.1 succinate dehydrogenase/fumarate reductase iron-sulfur subunit [Armatimonadota bacterium]MDR7506952.1 succinate dehydrogenase/fumarate reductase iron-sulfur subunit [Armatimonadota bacterium
MNAQREVTLRIWRGTASGGEFRDYRVRPVEGMVVLDAVRTVQAEQAPDLAVRWNCKAGKCGSCSAEVNGHPRLMCMTRLTEVVRDGEPVTVAPLRAFPVIKDLVTDVSWNFEVARTIPPFQPAPPGPDGKRRMYQHEVERVQEFRKCIECFLCQDVCHVIRDHPENTAVFAGPRFLVLLAAYEMHPLDTADRTAFVRSRAGVGFCNITRCCTEVCPENIRITDNAIIPLKERVVDRHYDPLLWLWRRLTGRA